ncbi:Exonuclease 1 [Camelus dromedarius]|uniref:Exonuclease 1 n=1 Tax=Camelus dromedarius TaxID=9838 RepID=A0A5N4CKT6_CAMDR|nr:Exonuclease 1 [Camelus dromedarius]
MGIQGLLQFIKEASEPIHVRKYKGQVVAVDTYCWLHKGAVACAEKLAKGEPTDKYVGFCMKFVNMLLSHGIKPVLVFDGCTLPSKKEVEKSRRERRQANLLKGKQLLREGKVSEARECFSRSINITHAMAHNVIKAARSQGVDCLVAPYEADAQLAYLNKAGIVQAIITEDSDLLAFGCKKVILKMDQFGNGLEIDQSRLGMCKQLGDVFTEEKFRYMCILSGCDYLSSLRGIGLAKACKVLRLANNPDIVKVIKKIGHYLKMNITVPEDYIKGFIRANNTFLYQLVFDPIKRKLIPLNAYEDDIDPETLSYAGQYVDDSTALQIALGNKDINTFEQIDDFNPDTAMKASSQPLDETAVADKETNGNESDCVDGTVLADTSVAHNSSEQTADDVTVIAADSQSLKTSRFTRTISPPTLGTLRSCFSWSGSLRDFSRTPSPSPSTALQQFRRKSDSPASLPERNDWCDVSQLKSDESGDESYPLHEVGWSSQSQESMELSPHNLSATKLSQPSSKDSDSEESDCNLKSLDNQGNQKSKLHLFHFSKKDTPLRNKVPGLYKSSSVDNLSTTKIKSSVPARVSGLSRKPTSIHKRNHYNAENKPGLQIKINELWKNFVFKKDSEKLPSCKKPDPLSPVKDNIQLTPEAEDDIFNNSECLRVQRAIFP